MELVLVLLFLFIIIIGFVFLSKNLNKPISYRQNGPLFSPAERSFLGVLDSAVSEHYRIFGKVRVADVLSPQKGLNRKDWQIAFNRISAKHFDYVLCNKDSLDLVAVIELDDKSHNKKSVKKRDAFLNSICEMANLKLIRFPAKASYSIVEIKQTVENIINPCDYNQ
ncbi:DUF2726 domain-containing protein [Thalassotalea ganghwensis]